MIASLDALNAWVRIETAPHRGAPALFLDRDGTVIENEPYLADPERVRLIPGARAAIGSFRAAGYAVIIVTNQSGIARGLCTPAQYRAVEARVLDELGAGLVDAVYACPFHPSGQAPFGGDHPWRKPGAGMLHDAATRFQLDLGRSLMVGDSLSDIQAGAAAGTGSLVHALTGHGAVERPAVEAFAAELKKLSSKSTVRYVSSLGDLVASECDA